LNRGPQRLVNTIVIPALKEKHGLEYTRYAIDDPQIQDYGSFMVLRFNRPSAQSDRLTQFAMEVDRCDLKVNRTWEVRVEALGKKALP
jgi:hypothetical protein